MVFKIDVSTLKFQINMVDVTVLYYDCFTNRFVRFQQGALKSRLPS